MTRDELASALLTGPVFLSAPGPLPSLREMATSRLVIGWAGAGCRERGARSLFPLLIFLFSSSVWDMLSDRWV